MGNLDRRRDPDIACHWYLKSLSIREKLAALEPDNTKYLCDLSYSFTRIGELMLKQGKPNDERAYSLRAAQAMERAVALHPNDPDIQYDLACTNSRIGRTAQALAALGRAVDLGWTDADNAAQDADLRSLWQLPAFTAILGRMRNAAAAG